MEALSDFELFYPGINYNLYFIDAEKEVLAKTLKSATPGQEDVKRLKNEWEISQKFKWENRRAVQELREIMGRKAILLNYVPGSSLREIFKEGPLEIGAFLSIGLSLAKTLMSFHKAGLIHRQISPSHLLKTQEGEEIVLIGLGMAVAGANIEAEIPKVADRMRPESLAYIAPEQTGRTEQKVNFSTDLYSLGVVFYEALTGTPPFFATDALQYMHAHIARAPQPPNELRPDIPNVLSRIILRLLEKDQDKRYLSTEALYKDLKDCMAQWQHSAELKDDLFSVPQTNFRERISEKLFSRESELQHLRSKWKRVKNGAVESVIVSGVPGSGKSLLCKQLRTEVAMAGGVFIRGRQDPYQTDVPYHSLVQAVEQFVTYLLTQEEEKLAFWRKRIGNALGNIGAVLTDIIPNLALVIGEQQELPALQGPELKNRLHRAFRSFFRSLAHERHPLVMLIEDVQWSDINTLDLLESLITDYRISNFLLLITFRTGVLEHEHPIHNKLNLIRKSVDFISEIELENLEQSDVDQMLVETFTSEIDQRKLLVSRIMTKTKGNPFYTTQYILAILREKLITYHSDTGKWHWESDGLDRQMSLGGVSEIMAGQVKQLNENLQQLLAMAACVGNRFNASILRQLKADEGVEVEADLKELQKNGLINEVMTGLPGSELAYQFTHEKVQEAAIRLLSSQERQDLHLAIGTLLLDQLDDEELEERIFDVVIQLNHAGKSKHDDRFRTKMATLNLRAGEKARDAAAFNPAYNYMLEGIAWLGPDKWTKHYGLSLALHNKAATLASLTGDSGELDRLYNEVLQHSKSLLDQELVYRAKIHASTSEKKLARGITYGLKYLEQLKYKFPKKPGKIRVILNILRMQLKLRKLTTESIAIMKNNTDPTALSAIRVLKDTSVAAYFVEPNLNPLILLKTMDLSLRFGNSPDSAFAYGGYGFILSGALGAYRRGYEFGDLSVDIVSNKNREEIKYYQLFIHNIFTRHWVEHTRNLLPDLEKAYRELLDLGNFEFGAYSAHSFIYFSFYLGNDLVELERTTAAYAESVSLLNQPTTHQRINMYWQAIHNLLGNSDNPILLKGEVYDEDEMISVHVQDKIIIALHNVYFLKAFLCYLFGRYEEAWGHAEKTDEYAEGAFCSYFVPLKDFLDVLILMGVTNSRKNLGKASKLIKKMKKYSQSAPDNFQCQYSLVKAEYHRVSNNESKARLFYEQAIQQARDTGNALVEALAWESAGKFYATQRSQTQAGIFLQNAFECYLRWGAMAKARQMEGAFGPYLQNSSNQIQDSVTRNRMATVEVVDFLSLVKTLRTLSTELDLARLFDKMMEIAIQNAGAERGILVLEKDGQWEIIARRDINKGKAIVLEGQFIASQGNSEGESLAPTGLLQYVIRTGKMLVINDVEKDNRFNDESYLRDQKTLSLLCLPLIKQKRLVGLLYLENSLTAGAFTTRIQEGLSLIGGQLAISIQNARLYEDLEEKIIQNNGLVSDLKIKVEEQEKTLKLFTQYVPEPVVKKALEAQEVSVWEGELREVAVMFCDIRGFTNMSEELPPREVVGLLNHYYSVMTDIILKYGGTVNQFIGDEIFAIFGAPLANPKKEINATLCALEMIAAIPELNRRHFNKFNKSLIVGIGINGGPVVAGNLGSKTKIAYSIIGDTANTGKRIESLTKVKDNSILISEYIYEKCADLIEAVAWEPVQVKGKKDQIQVYEVIGRKV